MNQLIVKIGYKSLVPSFRKNLLQSHLHHCNIRRGLTKKLQHQTVNLGFMLA